MHTGQQRTLFDCPDGWNASPDGRQVLFTADPRGYGQLFLAEVPPFEELPTLEQVSTLAPEV